MFLNHLRPIPDYEDIFPKGNIHDFRREIDVVSTEDFDVFHEAVKLWKLKKNDPIETLDETTSMQRGFKKRILENKKFGWGHSFIVFDGENILTKH